MERIIFGFTRWNSVPVLWRGRVLGAGTFSRAAHSWLAVTRRRGGEPAEVFRSKTADDGRSRARAESSMPGRAAVTAGTAPHRQPWAGEAATLLHGGLPRLLIIPLYHHLELFLSQTGFRYIYYDPRPAGRAGAVAGVVRGNRFCPSLHQPASCCHPPGHTFTHTLIVHRRYYIMGRDNLLKPAIKKLK